MNGIVLVGAGHDRIFTVHFLFVVRLLRINPQIVAHENVDVAIRYSDFECAFYDCT